jgi:hypothetical protein
MNDQRPSRTARPGTIPVPVVIVSPGAGGTARVRSPLPTLVDLDPKSPTGRAATARLFAMIRTERVGHFPRAAQTPEETR